MNTTAMTAEREALRIGVEYLAALFPVEEKQCTFVVENECIETKYIVDTQSMRLFGLCNDHAMCSGRAEDVHRADANRLCQKKRRNTSQGIGPWQEDVTQVVDESVPQRGKSHKLISLCMCVAVPTDDGRNSYVFNGARTTKSTRTIFFTKNIKAIIVVCADPFSLCPAR